MWSLLCLTFAIVCVVQADVNSFKIHQSYIYKNPQQILIPREGIPNVLAGAYQYYEPQQQQVMPQQQQDLPQPLIMQQMDTTAAQETLSYRKSLQMKRPRRFRPRTKIPKKPIVTKSFYVHTAPEDTEEELRDELKQLEEHPRKHYNVLFVKPPAQTSKNSALTLAKALKDDQRTVVYVLSKKTTASDLRDAIANTPHEVNKPDVHFIKYRTAEEAEHAQLSIQKQFAALEGPATISDEGTSPITSVIGSLDAAEEEEEEVEYEDSEEDYDAKQATSPPSLNQAYLPAQQQRL